MQGIRRQGRGFALQMLYQVEITKATDEESLGRFWLTVDASRKAQEFASTLVAATLKHRADLDRKLADCLENWKLGRLSVVVRNVLRLAACELIVLREAPPAVVIDEAVELTRSYMDEQSVPFVNSVLEKLRLAYAQPARDAEEDEEA